MLIQLIKNGPTVPNYEFFQGLINSQISNKMILIYAFKQRRVLGCSVHFIGNDSFWKILGVF